MRLTAALLCAVLLATAARAQMPRITTFFPMGARAGATVEVEVRGSGLDGANLLLVTGKGLTGTVTPGDAKVDETHRPLFQAKCAGCHELRGPSNRSLTPAQWAATVDRMVKQRSAPLSADETAKVTEYLMGAAKAGKVTARLSVAADALPGLYEVRLATPRGVSSPFWFEVGSLPEVVAIANTAATAQPLALPATIHGGFLAAGERHYFSVGARKGERLVFNLKAFRYNELSQTYFNPNLRLYDPSGKRLAENHGYFDFDPLIDWVCPADGTYTLEVRDLLGRPNPGSVYRLTAGRLPYETVLWPPVGAVGASVATSVVGDLTEGARYTVAAPAAPGVWNVPGPFGPQKLLTVEGAIVRDDAPQPAAAPTTLTGTIGKPGEVDAFPITGGGEVTFECYAARLGAPTALSTTLVNAAGAAMQTLNGDGRMTLKLEAGQTYTLRVADRSGQGGATRVYAVTARPARPGLEVLLRPDNLTLRPGISLAAQVLVTRREGVDGDIEVSVDGLPPGVSASPLRIPPDRSTGWLLLSAAPNAAPVEKPIRVTATARGPLGEARTVATPQDVPLLNNDPRPRSWSDAIVAVRGQADYRIELVNPQETIRVHPREAYPVKVRIVRREGFKGNVTVFLAGLPQGWTANPEATTGDALTLHVRPDGNNQNPFLKRDPKWTPIAAVLEASADDFRFAFGTIPVRVASVNGDDDPDR